MRRDTNRLTTCALMAAAGIATCANAGLPAVQSIDMRVRANPAGMGFGVPNESQFPNNTPSVNDLGQVAVGYLDVNFDDRIWAVGTTRADPYFITSDPKINNAGMVSWSVASGFGDPPGVYLWDTVTNTGGQETLLPAGSSGWGTPVINNNGLTAYRATTAIGVDELEIYDGTTATPIANDDGTSYDFITSAISFNDHNRIGAKTFLAGGTEALVVFEDGQPDNISLTEGGAYTGFLNNTDMNNNDRIAAHAFLSGGGSAVIGVDRDGTITEYASTNDGFTDIALFGPVIDDNGWVAFRGIDAMGEGVFLSDGNDIEAIARLGDMVMTDQGMATITGFSAGLDISNGGHIAFNARIDVDGQNIGRAIFVATVPPPGALTALAMGGLLATRRRR